MAVGFILMTVLACTQAPDVGSESTQPARSTSGSEHSTTILSTIPPTNRRDPFPSFSTQSTEALASVPTGQRVGTVCTEIGCSSSMDIELSEVDIQPNAVYRFQICVDGDCRSESITIDTKLAGSGEVWQGESEQTHNTQEGRVVIMADSDSIVYFLPEREYEQFAAVSIRFEDANGTLLAGTEGAVEVAIEIDQPNGPDCPPVCYHGRLTI
jgi:hypothetical protein